MMPMFDVQGFILVGGASSRMGKDKAQLMFGDLTAVELIGRSLNSITHSVHTVGGSEARVKTLANIPDLRSNWGPLAGIESALRHAKDAKAAQCVVVGCDFPFVTAELFNYLLRTKEADAVIPMQDDGRAQPLCAVYRVKPCLIATAEALAAGQHSPRALLDRVRAVYVPFHEIAHLEGAKNFFFNVNTPENYQLAQRIFTQLHHRP
jgi:molybdopterin-guanine dinucleotide biosynthesis protein A